MSGSRIFSASFDAGAASCVDANEQVVMVSGDRGTSFLPFWGFMGEGHVACTIVSMI